MEDPRSLVPESVMPPYAFLSARRLDYANIAGALKANRAVGVPYTDEMIDQAVSDLEAQVDPFSENYDALLARYPKAQIRNFDGDDRRITEMDALIAYMQILGVMVDFEEYQAEENYR